MTQQLKGKVAAVTGGASGIGLASVGGADRPGGPRGGG